ncbi:hypothetical protein HPB50_015432 [Hyalomma asiaticum]|uniref:Uncharacterized protein n=1 Tax=Hyalomma asiaticum TaxID=266040 RepID=A0ACB7TH12_HYAAI|nr:hypothetical protein HPB50_015432 [Hyalomma asiaticum]
MVAQDASPVAASSRAVEWRQERGVKRFVSSLGECKHRATGERAPRKTGSCDAIGRKYDGLRQRPLSSRTGDLYSARDVQTRFGGMRFRRPPPVVRVRRDALR